MVYSAAWRTCSAARSIWCPKRPCDRNCALISNRSGSMSDTSKREWRFYLDDMIDFAEKVLAYTQGLDQAGFEVSGMTYDATLRNLELIGEAATHIPDGVRAAHPEIPCHPGAGCSRGSRQRVKHFVCFLSVVPVRPQHHQPPGGACRVPGVLLKIPWPGPATGGRESTGGGWRYRLPPA